MMFLRRSLMHHLDSALVPVVLVSSPLKNILSKTLQAFPSACYVKVSRALAIGAIPFSPATKTSDVRKRFDTILNLAILAYSDNLILLTFHREEEIAKGLEYEVGTIGTDIVMLQEDIKMVTGCQRIIFGILYLTFR